MDSKVTAAIAAISQDAWTPIRYPRAIWDDQLGCWVSDAQVAEVEYTAFTSAKKSQAITARLIVRRVRDLNRQAPAGQDELFPAWRYHAVFTDSPVELVQAEEQHRDHAITYRSLPNICDFCLRDFRLYQHADQHVLPLWTLRPTCESEFTWITLTAVDDLCSRFVLNAERMGHFLFRAAPFYGILVQSSGEGYWLADGDIDQAGIRG